MTSKPERILKYLFHKIVTESDPFELVIKNLPVKPQKKVIVIGIGKASVRMAKAVISKWGEIEGIILTPYETNEKLPKIQIFVGSHPQPSYENLKFTKKIISILKKTDSNNFVLFLISGGGSSLLCHPCENLQFEDKKKTHQLLINHGISINKINIVRKHLSKVKGGQLAALAYPSEMISLIISDVPGDNLSNVSSGPTIGEKFSSKKALSILTKNKINAPKNVFSILKKPSNVLKINDYRLKKVTNILIGNFYKSFQKIIDWSKNNNFDIQYLGDDIEGEAKKVGKKQAKIAKKIQLEMKENSNPVLLVSGGECTVNLKKQGRGGPNLEFVLGALIELNGQHGIFVMSCDTDGIDGNSGVAGAFATPNTIKETKKIGLNAKKLLDDHNSLIYFEKIGNIIETGPTGTNINDFRVFYIIP